MTRCRHLLYCLCVSLLAACGGGGGGSSAPPATVSVTPPTASVMVGQQIQLAATTNATGPVTWSSSNTAIAIVDATGLVMALGLGQVTITATSGEASGTAALTTTTGILFNAISAGDNHTCGLTPAGVAYCWGDNSSGQLGNGTMSNSATPVPVAGGLSFSMLSAGGQQTCGVIGTPMNYSGGAVYCWGNNSSGQLGNGTTTNSTTPSLVAGGLVFSAVSVGGKHVCGDIGDIVPYCWGDNSSGQLGNGTMTNSSVPVPVTTGIYNILIEYVSAGGSHTCALAGGQNGSAAVCWGDNSSGQLGNGTTTNSAVPVATNTYVGPQFSAGTLFTCAYNFYAGVVGVSVCFGNNGSGQLGNGTTTNSAIPMLVASALTFEKVSAGDSHTCGLSLYGIPFCWGDNSSGQLGNGTTTNSATPVAVAGSLDFVMVSAGGSHTCGVTNYRDSPTYSGAVYCWGDNTYGQLGNGWTTSSSQPVNVAGSP